MSQRCYEEGQQYEKASARRSDLLKRLCADCGRALNSCRHDVCTKELTMRRKSHDFFEEFGVFALCPSAVETNPMWMGGRIVYLGREVRTEHHNNIRS